MIVAQATYEPTDPTVDSQITTLKASGADTFFDIAAPKAAAQAIRKAHDLGWQPLHLLQSVAASIASTLKPAGLDNAVGVVSSAYYKDPTDPQWAGDPGVAAYLAWMKRYYPAGNPDDVFNVWGYSQAQTMEQVLKQCGDDLTRENVMRQAANLKDLQLPMLLPGHQDQHLAQRLLSHQAGAADEVRWQAVGPVRRGAGALIARARVHAIRHSAPM